MKILLLPFAVLASAPALLAQAIPTSPDLPHANTKTVLDAILTAGPVMFVLLALSIFSVMLIIVFFFTIRRGAVVISNGPLLEFEVNGETSGKIFRWSGESREIDVLPRLCSIGRS
jgi:hypothetical protein